MDTFLLGWDLQKVDHWIWSIECYLASYGKSYRTLPYKDAQKMLKKLYTIRRELKG